jgi:hypothetical protein
LAQILIPRFPWSKHEPFRNHSSWSSFCVYKERRKRQGSLGKAPLTIPHHQTLLGRTRNSRKSSFPRSSLTTPGDCLANKTRARQKNRQRERALERRHRCWREGYACGDREEDVEVGLGCHHRSCGGGGALRRGGGSAGPPDRKDLRWGALLFW